MGNSCTPTAASLMGRYLFKEELLTNLLNGPSVAIGVLNLDGQGKVTGNASVRNFSGSNGDASTITGTYTVDSQGILRLSITIQSGGAFSSQQTLDHVLYSARQNTEFHGFRTTGTIRVELVRQ